MRPFKPPLNRLWGSPPNPLALRQRSQAAQASVHPYGVFSPLIPVCVLLCCCLHPHGNFLCTLLSNFGHGEVTFRFLPRQHHHHHGSSWATRPSASAPWLHTKPFDLSSIPDKDMTKTQGHRLDAHGPHLQGGEEGFASPHPGPPLTAELQRGAAVRAGP